jgi:hypothetical protein
MQWTKERSVNQLITDSGETILSVMPYNIVSAERYGNWAVMGIGESLTFLPGTLVESEAKIVASRLLSAHLRQLADQLDDMESH